MEKDLVLIYSNKLEPVTATLINQKKFPIYPISLQDFLNNCVVFDEISDDYVNISWHFSDGRIISNKKNTMLINRVLGCGSELFQDFAKKDRNYAQSELWGYLFFALNSFPSITSTPNSYTLCGGGHPLPRQWEAAKSVGIKTPEYYLGSMKCITSKWNKEETICSSIHNSYFWKMGYKKNAGFAFKKPTGTPYLVFIRGDMASIHAMDNSTVNFEKQIQQKIISLALQVNQIFKYPIAEVFVFLNTDQLTFGMINHIPYGCSLIPIFQDSIIDWAESIAKDQI